MSFIFHLLISIFVLRSDGFLLDDKHVSTTPSTPYSVEDLIHLIAEEKALRSNLETKLNDLTRELQNVERSITDFYHEVKDKITRLQVAGSAGSIDKRYHDLERKLNETKLFVENITSTSHIEHSRTESKLVAIENTSKLNENKIHNMTGSIQQTNHLIESRVNGIENMVIHGFSGLNSTVADVVTNMHKRKVGILHLTTLN